MENVKNLISANRLRYIIKDRPNELSYYVNLIRACLIFKHHLIYTGEFLYLLYEFLNFANRLIVLVIIK